MTKELIFIDWDDTLVNRTNAESVESVVDENNNVYQLSPMFMGAVDALQELQKKYQVMIISSRGDLNKLRQLQLKNHGLESSILPLDSFMFDENDAGILFTRYGETNFPDKASFMLHVQKTSGTLIKAFIDDDHSEIEAAQKMGIPSIHVLHKNDPEKSESLLAKLIHQVDNLQLYQLLNGLAAEIRSHSRSISFGRKIAGFFSMHLPVANSLEIFASHLQKKSVEEVSEEFNQYLEKIDYKPNKKGDITVNLAKAKEALDSHLATNQHVYLVRSG